MERMNDRYRFDHNVIEYSITGDGKNPVLMLHGGHSNSKEEFGVDELVSAGFTVIIPSRPGYGETSKNIGESLAKAAEYYIALLNHLSIDKVHLMPISAGGTSGIYLAAKYPDRIKSLTLLSAVTKEWLKPSDNLYKISQIIFRPPFEKLTWGLLSTFNNLFPKFIFKLMSASFSTLPYAEIFEQTTRSDIEVIRKMNNRQSSGHGFLIDLSQSKNINAYHLHEIQCPTLIIHSKNDASVPLVHAHFAHENISDSTLISADSWGHIIWIGHHSPNMDAEVSNFLKSIK